MLQVNQQLVSILEDSAGAEIDLDNAALRVTLDVIGRVGFGKDFGATRDLNSGKANLAFDMMEAGKHCQHDALFTLQADSLCSAFHFVTSKYEGRECTT